MDTTDVPFSRISKLFIDRDEATPEDILRRRRKHAIVLCCGEDVAHSYTLQLAVLTCAIIANRCFPGAVRMILDPQLANAPLLIWPSLALSFGETLTDFLGTNAITSPNTDEQDRRVVFGNASANSNALRVTFDGWIAKVGPTGDVERLPEREYCSLAGVLAAAIAVSEIFMSFAEISLEASRRTVALSLWRPDLAVSHPEALGIPVQFLPRSLWTLGLGHLGNAYLWSLATLPYGDPENVEIYLNDFDRIEQDNVETSLLFREENEEHYKTRTCAAWLEARRFQTRIVERRFDEHFRCAKDEPKLALCGFDSNRARRYLATAQFDRVVESGLGATANNFDTIGFHTFPNPRPAEELWPDPSPEEDIKRVRKQERLAQQNAAYSQITEDECGRYRLAGKSVAVPFVGAVASTLVVAETIRILHNGPAFTDAKLATGVIDAHLAKYSGNYTNEDSAPLGYCLQLMPGQFK